MYEGRPPWIPAGAFRKPMTAGKMSKFLVIGGNTVATFIKKCADEGRPIRSWVLPCKGPTSTKVVYRPIDVVAAARGRGLSLAESIEQRVAADIKDLTLERDALARDVETLQAELEELRVQLKTAHDVMHVLGGKRIPSRREVIEAAAQMQSTCGVYFLVDEQEIVYVGQSVNVPARVATHATEKAGKFKSWCFLECPRHALDLVESLCIHAFSPPLNGHPPLSLDRILQDGVRFPNERDRDRREVSRM